MKKPKGILQEFEELQKNPEALAAKLREIKISQKWCPKCGEVVHEMEVYCRSCGTKNPYYDQEIFLNFWEDSLEKIIAEDCAKGHPHGDTPEERAVHTGFCLFCGKYFETPQ